jgi:hypothetical protein
VITAFGRSTHSSGNSDDPSLIGQGVLQGSSSACPIYIFSSNVCLSTCKKHSTGAKFIHPISGNLISNSAIQFSDDTSRFTNSLGCGITDSDQQPKNNIDSFFNHAQKNITTWNDLIFLSGGRLHPQKCYFYSFHPSYNHKRQHMSHQQLQPSNPLHLTDRDNQAQIPLEHRSPYDTKHTLGVILAPDGSATQQIQLIISRAREVQGKLCNSSLLRKNRWIALTSIIEPSLFYPLVATYFTQKQIQPYQCIISNLQCNALL